MSKAA
jgi:hypothetical protein